MLTIFTIAIGVLFGYQTLLHYGLLLRIERLEQDIRELLIQIRRV